MSENEYDWGPPEEFMARDDVVKTVISLIAFAELDRVVIQMTQIATAVAVLSGRRPSEVVENLLESMHELEANWEEYSRALRRDATELQRKFIEDAEHMERVVSEEEKAERL